MTLESLVTWVQRRIGNYSVDEILEVVNEIQELVYNQNTLQTQYLDSSTGMPPYITTQNNVYEYDCPSTCRETAAVFSTTLPSNYSRIVPAPGRKTYYFRGRGFHQLAVESRSAIPGSVAKLIFRFNPGATTTTYYHLYYLKATEITDISQNLLLPSHTHIYLRKAVQSIFRTGQFGESGTDLQVLELVAKKIRQQLNRGLHAGAGSTPIREEFQEYPEYRPRGYYS
jgi:hypothetical protein